MTGACWHGGSLYVANTDTLFRIDGERREVPNGDGKLTSSPLGRGSYRALVTG